MNSNTKIKRTRSTPPPAKRKKVKLSKKTKLKHNYNHDDSSEASSRNNDKEVKLINKTSKRKENRKEKLKDDSEHDVSYEGSSQSQGPSRADDVFTQSLITNDDAPEENVNNNLEDMQQLSQSKKMLKAYFNNVQSSECHPNNASCMCLNVAMACSRNFLSENKPVENGRMKHYKELKELNEHLLDWDAVTTKDAHALRLFLWNSLTEDYKSTAMHWIQKQLMEDMLKEDSNSKWNIDNFDDVLRWHGPINGAIKDEIAWRSKHMPFDDRSAANNETQQTKVDWGVHYECESSNGFFETMFNHAKRMIFKTIECRRETDHGKKLSLTASDDQVKK